MTSAQKKQQHKILAEAHNTYSKSLNAYAVFKTCDRAMSEDLVQDTFMKTWMYLMKNGKVELMKAFLYHVLNGLIIDEYRKPKHVSLDTLLDNGFFETGDEHSERAVNMIDGKGATLLINHLPEKYRDVIYMRYMQDFSLKEMSLATGQTRNAVAVQIHRGIERLKLLYNTREHA